MSTFCIDQLLKISIQANGVFSVNTLNNNVDISFSNKKCNTSMVDNTE